MRFFSFKPKISPSKSLVQSLYYKLHALHAAYLCCTLFHQWNKSISLNVRVRFCFSLVLMPRNISKWTWNMFVSAGYSCPIQFWIETVGLYMCVLCGGVPVKLVCFFYALHSFVLVESNVAAFKWKFIISQWKWLQTEWCTGEG